MSPKFGLQEFHPHAPPPPVEKWQKWVEKPNGEIRKRFEQWAVPKKIRTRLGLDDGSKCTLTIRPGTYSMEPLERVLTSNGEFRLPKKIAEDFRARATANPKAVIVFEIYHGPMQKPATLSNLHRRFWVVSPNVKYHEKTVPEWKQASVDFSAAFMGWGPDDQSHRIGRKFAHVISEGDVILIARRFRYRPDVVGFGVVTGAYQTHIKGFTAPGEDDWHGSIRTLSPFIPRTGIPSRLDIMKVLNQPAALHELHPASDPDHRLICDWMTTALSVGMIGNEGIGSNSKSRSPRVSLKSLFDPSQFDFEVRTPERVRIARKLEAELVKGYRQWLGKKHRELKVANYQGLRCDAYEGERNNLIEAKSSGGREYIRMAVGQLLDYAYLGRKKFVSPNMAILLPRKPEANLLEWLAEVKISVIWKQRRTFLDNANGQFT